MRNTVNVHRPLVTQFVWSDPNDSGAEQGVGSACSVPQAFVQGSLFLTATDTVKTLELMVQFSWEHLELIGFPFGEVRRKRALSERQDKETPGFWV